MEAEGALHPLPTITLFIRELRSRCSSVTQFDSISHTLMQVWVPSWIGFLVGVSMGAGLFFAIDVWGIVIPAVLLSPVWFWGLFRTGCFGLTQRFRGGSIPDHQELRD